MGNLTKFISFLVFIDLLFLIFIPVTVFTPQAILIKGMVYGLSTGEVSGTNIVDSNSTGSWSYISDKYFCSASPVVPSDLFSISTISNIASCNSGSIFWLMLGLMVIAFVITKGISVLGTGIQSGGSVDIPTLIWMSLALFFYLSIGIDFISVFGTVQSISPPFSRILALIIFIPIGILYFFTLIEWIRGKD